MPSIMPDGAMISAPASAWTTDASASGTQRVRLPVEIWGLRNTYTALITGPKKVNSVVIDPDGWYPDVDRSNNRWPAGTP